jgi:hypothetical protein
VGQNTGNEEEDFSLRSELYEKELALDAEMQRTAAIQARYQHFWCEKWWDRSV